MIMMNKSANYISKATVKLLPWLLSLLITLVLVLFMIMFKTKPIPQEDIVTVRSINVEVRLPPPPPPPEIQQTHEKSSSATINLIGLGEGPQLKYSDIPRLAKPKKNTLVIPKFDIDSLNLGQVMSVDFPTLKVKNLDQIPKVISYKFIKAPAKMVKRRIKRIESKVEIIIDQQGVPYIKSIVDPGYVEMIDIIRQWIKHARFTIPKKNGQPVQALYLYSLNFNYNI